MVNNEIDEALGNTLINQANDGVLPDLLGLNDIAELFFYHKKETKKQKIEPNGINQEKLDDFDY